MANWLTGGTSLLLCLRQKRQKNRTGNQLSDYQRQENKPLFHDVTCLVKELRWLSRSSRGTTSDVARSFLLYLAI
jgi:hypothetical protein